MGRAVKPAGVSHRSAHGVVDEQDPMRPSAAIQQEADFSPGVVSEPNEPGARTAYGNATRYAIQAGSASARSRFEKMSLPRPVRRLVPSM